MSALLNVSGLSVAYGGIQAVRDLSLEVARGELVCLIGANGAGKTTALKAVSGLIAPKAGSVRFDGQPLVGLPAHLVARRGLALVPEGRGVFPRMSVAENLMMGAYVRQDRAAIAADLDQIYSLLPRLTERRSQMAGLLSGGEQQMLALGRAMMARPRLLLLDEPSMGLAPLMVKAVFDIIRQIAAGGVAVLLIEQNAHLALKTCARGYVLENGAITLSGPADALAADPAVRQAYLGEQAAAFQNYMQFMDPAVSMKWMGAAMDPNFYTAAMAPFMNPNLYMKWMMAPMDPRAMQMGMQMMNPGMYTNWMMAPMSPQAMNAMMAPMNPATYTNWMNTAVNPATYGTMGAFVNPATYSNAAQGFNPMIFMAPMTGAVPAAPAAQK